MLTAMNLTKVHDFQSPRDPDYGTPNATTFKLAAIPARIYMALKDDSARFITDGSAEGGMRTDFKPNATALELARFAIKGIQNLVDSEGAAIEFRTQKFRMNGVLYDVLHEDVLAVLDVETLREISAKVRELCELSPAAEKNSAG